MFRGGFLAESIRPGSKLRDVRFVVTEVRRGHVPNATPDQPPIWTLIEFEVDDAQAEALANSFADALDEPGWYADFQSDSEHFVVFPRRVFRYRRGDRAARAEAAEHGRSLRIPESQLDWPD